MERSEQEQWHETYRRIQSEVAKVLVEYAETLDGVLAGFFAGGHVLVEGAPGLGKTLLVRTLSAILGLPFSRIQFTPDLMPADITGTHILVEGEKGERRFEFQKGPLFASLILADEINRATPKTQSALLEAMQEQAVTVTGTRYPLPLPFFVMATQNPIEMEGTYPLPEAQLDRFLLKLTVGLPSEEGMAEIVYRTTGVDGSTASAITNASELLAMQHLVRQVPVAEEMVRFAARLVRGTHPPLDGAQGALPRIVRYVRYGASPRATQGLILAAKARALMQGRLNVSLGDLEMLAYPVLRHRLILNFEGEAEGIHPDALIKDLLDGIPRPRPEARLLAQSP